MDRIGVTAEISVSTCVNSCSEDVTHKYVYTVKGTGVVKL